MALINCFFKTTQLFRMIKNIFLNEWLSYISKTAYVFVKSLLAMVESNDGKWKFI